MPIQNAPTSSLSWLEQIKVARAEFSYELKELDVALTNLQSENDAPSMCVRVQDILSTGQALFLRRAEIQAELTVIQSDLASLYNGGALVSSLPDEILVMIFAFGCPSTRNISLSNPCPTPAPSESPPNGVPKERRAAVSNVPSPKLPIVFELLVSHVTRRWRTIALGTPALWNYILRVPSRRSLDRISTYIHRSNALPVDFYFISGEYREERSGDITGFCDLMKPHIWRCCKLAAHLRHDPGSFELLRLISSTMLPLLKSIRIHRFDPLSFRKPIEVFSLTAQNLSSFCLSGSSISFMIPPQCITSLSLAISSSHGEKTGNMLSTLTALTHLELSSGH